MQKHRLLPCNHNHICQVSPQQSCGNTWQIWLSLIKYEHGILSVTGVLCWKTSNCDCHGACVWYIGLCSLRNLTVFILRMHLGVLYIWVKLVKFCNTSHVQGSSLLCVNNHGFRKALFLLFFAWGYCFFFDIFQAKYIYMSIERATCYLFRWSSGLCLNLKAISPCMGISFTKIKQSCDHLGGVSIRKTVLPGMVIPMLKIRRPNGRLIFNMEIAIRR